METISATIVITYGNIIRNVWGTKDPVACSVTQKLVSKVHCQDCSKDEILIPKKTGWRRVLNVDLLEEEVQSIEQVRQGIRDIVTTASSMNSGISVVGSPPGSGKSTISADTLRQTDLRVLYLVQRHDLFDDIIQHLGATEYYALTGPPIHD